MAVAVSLRRLTAVALAIGAGASLAAASQAQADSIWRIQPAPDTGRMNRWLDHPSATSGVTLGRSLGSGVHAPNQYWVFRRRGGTVQRPWYQIYNRATGRCLSFGSDQGDDQIGPSPVTIRTCTTSGLDHFQFRTLTGQPVNPGLTIMPSAPRLLRIHWAGQTNSTSGRSCLVVPYSRFEVGTRIGIQRCSQSANHKWWVYRTTA